MSYRQSGKNSPALTSIRKTEKFSLDDPTQICRNALLLRGLVLAQGVNEALSVQDVDLRKGNRKDVENPSGRR